MSFLKTEFQSACVRSSIVNSLVTLKAVDLGFKAVVSGLVDAVGLLPNDNPIQPVLENGSLQPLLLLLQSNLDTPEPAGFTGGCTGSAVQTRTKKNVDKQQEVRFLLGVDIYVALQKCCIYAAIVSCKHHKVAQGC